MIISVNKIVFLHIPKTGGTSIEKAIHPIRLNPYIFYKEVMFGLINNQYSQHFNLANIKKHTNIDIDTYFIFTIVRNTWDRLVSAYKYLYEKQDFSKFIQDKCIKLQNNQLIQTDHFNTQMVFIKNSEGKVVPDFIGNFEKLQSDFDYVCDANNMPKQKLEIINQSKNKKHYLSYYDNYTKDMVRETYKEEIDFFDFKFE